MVEDKSPLVLVVEDDLIFSSRIASVLRRLGYPCAMAGSASEALEKATAEPPAAVLVNLSQPRLDPLELIRSWKASEDLRGIPVVGYVGHMEADVQQAALKAGCDHVVADSVIAGDLERVLGEVL